MTRGAPLLLCLAALLALAAPAIPRSPALAVAGPPSTSASEGPLAASASAGQSIYGGEPVATAERVPWSARFRSLVGIVVLMGLAWAFSVDRSRVAWRVVAWGVCLQFVFAVFILKTPMGEEIFQAANRVVVALLGFTLEGARFVFGDLVFDTVPVGTGVPGTNEPLVPAAGMAARTGAYVAFNVLPTIIFFSSLMTVLYHLRIMQAVVKGIGWVMQRTMRTSGAETLTAAGNIFVGQTEAPLLIKPYVERLTMSELMAVMTAGFATVAGGVMAAYVGMLRPYFPDIAGHLMAASVMSAPAALVMAKLMYPEEGRPETAGSLAVSVERPDVNVIDAAARGASDGLGLALNVGAMLLAFLALLHMLDALVGWTGGLVGFEDITLEGILGWVMAPVAWIMGVEWADARLVGSLLGIKTVLNEFLSYLQLSSIVSGESPALSPRSVIITTYALSGFANFGSVAIQIAGIGGIAPSRRHDLARLGVRAMVAGSLAGFMTAAFAGLLI